MHKTSGGNNRVMYISVEPLEDNFTITLYPLVTHNYHFTPC